MLSRRKLQYTVFELQPEERLCELQSSLEMERGSSGARVESLRASIRDLQDQLANAKKVGLPLGAVMVDRRVNLAVAVNIFKIGVVAG